MTTTIGVRSIHLVCSLQRLAVLWWENQPHPRPREHYSDGHWLGFVADDFAAWLCETMSLEVIAIAGDNNSEDYFAELVGWHPMYRQRKWNRKRKRGTK